MKLLRSKRGRLVAVFDGFPTGGRYKVRGELVGRVSFPADFPVTYALPAIASECLSDPSARRYYRAHVIRRPSRVEYA